MRDLMLKPTLYRCASLWWVANAADVSDDEGIDPSSRVAISLDQDEPTRYVDDWFSDEEQDPLQVVASAVIGQPDVDVTEEEISAKKRLACGMTAA